MSLRHLLAVGAAAVALDVAGPVSAQKSKHTIRVAINDMFSVSDPYHFPLDENAQFYRTIYSSLVEFNEYTGKFEPFLAKSWKRINSTTIEFTLREGVKFHNGNEFTADDVLTTLAYLADPKVRIRFKARYTWLKKVEKLGKYKVRLTAKNPNATDMADIAYRFEMLDGKSLNSLERKSDYGKATPYGTGPYKIKYVDRNKGILVERVEDYYGDAGYGRAPVQFVHGIPMPDRQTQKAQLITGGVDMLRDVTNDDARNFATMPGIKATPTPTGMLMYITLDAAGRSKNKVMMDERVRKAFIMAIDREKIVKAVVAGGGDAEFPKSICFKANIACLPSTTPYPYNPTESKRLLAEAGHPNGIDLTFYVHAPIQHVAVALSGELRKVGIRTTITPLPLMVYVKKRGAGDFTAFNGFYPTGAHPDAANLLNFFFGANRDYWNDPIIDKAYKDGSTEFDVAKRAKIYEAAFDQVNEKAYIYPLSEKPIVWVHTKDIKVMRNNMSTFESRLGDYAWSDYKEK
ncbi:MAG: hypothetical protein HQ503_10735 [Rhodospirillales bacterium]|nr:hypothetical protein [Rhodospirillales bacterium]